MKNVTILYYYLTCMKFNYKNSIQIYASDNLKSLSQYNHVRVTLGLFCC